MRNLHDFATRLLTGSYPDQLYDDAALGKSPIPWQSQRPDLSVHALASERLAQRTNPFLANFIGFGKEAAQGLGQAIQGNQFFGEHGFDEDDIQANQAGIERARRQQELDEYGGFGY